MKPGASLPRLNPSERSVGQAAERFDVERKEFVLRADGELVVRMEFEEIQLCLTYRE